MGDGVPRGSEPHQSHPGLGVQRVSGWLEQPWGAGAVPAAVGGHWGRRLLFIIVKMWAAAVGPAGRQHMIPAAWG